MHLQQTKVGSRATGGPQYWLQNVPDIIATYLRKKKVVRVALVTPYGATPSHFLAVHRDAKVRSGKIVRANAQHDRIQKARAGQSIGEAIRDWYALSTNADFERIDVEVATFEHDDAIYLTPTACKLRGQKPTVIPRPEQPLSLHRHFQSQLWMKQLSRVRKQDEGGFKWALDEIRRVVSAHEPARTPNVDEKDLLRASGALKVFGVQLGPYVVKGYDCRSVVRFLNYPPYEVPVEIKKRSRDFDYQQQEYGKEELSRAVILCVRHDLVNPPQNIDVVELSLLARPERLGL